MEKGHEEAALHHAHELRAKSFTDHVRKAHFLVQHLFPVLDEQLWYLDALFFSVDELPSNNFGCSFDTSIKRTF